MKTRLIGVLLTVTLVLGSLTSCLLFERNPLLSPDQNGDTVINVQGGPQYGDINITSTADKNLLAASKAILSSVSVQCAFVERQYTQAGAYAGTKETAAAGSGVIYKLDKNKGEAYIITNYHVVYNGNSINPTGISTKINVCLYGMEHTTSENKNYAIQAEYVGGSMYYDIAVLKVSGSPVLMRSNARAVDIADSDEVTVLDTAIAIGNPSGAGLSATVGYINVDSEEIKVQIDSKSEPVKLRVMRTDAAVNGGNSGGGLFNETGALIGIVNAKDADEMVENIGYAIPSNVAKAIADNAIHYSDGTVKRCMLGITVGVREYSTKYDETTGKIYKFEKVVITELAQTAAVKGILEVGDIINSITVDGVEHDVTRIYHVVDSMLYARVGSSVVINVTRGGAARNINLPITENMLTDY